ncbi:putative cofactor-binding repeat-containing protein [Tranquillimonas rosea]|uniref:Putative cofactor-binding repeat-containing protein n=1 Tax=Tranquillimonas rosea TaxID=641238 RepID=A0A1H9UIH9_9RHOB|nr:hypothetical protein [Tranquillimonas rosea]SES09172.1 putative cofactor-binding repeat-containing protein [Tranquillimonas rosea]
MVQTITIGSCVSVQGNVVRNLEDGRVTIQVGEQAYTGFPVRTPPQPTLAAV